MKKTSLKNFATLLCVVSIAALSLSLFTELFLERRPCSFCLWQRGIYVGIFACSMLLRIFPRFASRLLQANLLVGLGISVTHTLVELALIDVKCTSLPSISVEQFTSNLQHPCRTGWFFLGLPIAAYNCLVFVGMFVLSFFVNLPQSCSKISMSSLLKHIRSTKTVLLFLLTGMIPLLCFGAEKIEKCKAGSSCFEGAIYPEEQGKQFYIFMDSEVPENIWITLSQDVSQLHGSFVIRGFPKGDPKLLARKMLQLREKGVLAEIIIDPVAFKRFNVTASPTFVVVDGEDFDKVSGSVTVESALEQLARRGETTYAKKLLKKLRRQRRFP